MKYVVLMVVIIVSINSYAAGFSFSSGKKKKSEYLYSECVEGTFAVKATKANLTANEFCNYGKKGCSSIKSDKKLTGYCAYETLSECFNKKAWLSIDQILGISLSKPPGLTTYGLKAGSKHEGKTCVFWD